MATAFLHWENGKRMRPVTENESTGGRADLGEDGGCHQFWACQASEAVGQAVS